MNTMTVEDYRNQNRVVYVIERWARPEWYKIGCTGNLLGRYGGPKILDRVVKLIPVPPAMNLYEAERAIQKIFMDRHISGDIFALTQADVGIVKQLFFEDAYADS